MILLALLPSLLVLPVLADHGPRDDLHFSLEARQANIDGSTPIYKNPRASIEARVKDLLPRMTLAEKVSQLYAVKRPVILSVDSKVCA